jgi:hypothetical protein
MPSQPHLTLPDALGAAISILVLLAGMAAVLLSTTRAGPWLWRMMLVGAILGGSLAQLRYAEGHCSWSVGWPFAVTRVHTNCGDVWATSRPNAVARIGNIAIAMTAMVLAGSSCVIIGRRRRARREAP